MSVMRSLRGRVIILVLGAVVTLLVFNAMGRGGKKVVDPYVHSTLRAVTRGDTLSYNFLFEIPAPKFDYVKGNTGIVRDGNLLEFVVGTNLEQSYQSYAGARLGVRKFYSPSPHLMILRVKRGEVVTPVDSCRSYVLPRVMKISERDLQIPGVNYNEELDWRDLEKMKPLMPKESDQPLIPYLSLVERFVQAPPVGEAASGGGDKAWYAVFPQGSLQFERLTPGAAWMLEMFQSRNLPLFGSFSVSAIDSNYASRRAEHGPLGHVVGKVQLNWFRYANNVIKGRS